MDDPLLVGGFQRLGYLPRDGQRLVQRHRAARDPLRKVFALYELHDQRLRRRPCAGRRDRVFEPVDLRDVGVIQRGEDFGFTQQPREPLGIAGERVGQHLQRDITVEVCVPRAVDASHAARADEGGDFIRAEASPRCERHRGRPNAETRSISI